MRALQATELLSIWEQGQAAPPIQRALLLLAAACPDLPADDLAELSIGQRDSRLLTLRQWAFGAQFISVVACPACGERLETSFNVADIRAEPDTDPAETLALAADGYQIEARLPNSRDLAALASYAGGDTGRRFLLQRCLLTVQREGQTIAADQLPPHLTDKLLSRMAEADPQADVRLVLICPACAHEWRALFDIVAYFWSEINTWARRVLREVHLLASVYGWAEADILAMNPRRRQLYLEMISGA